jgi:hypothetical protein
MKVDFSAQIKEILDKNNIQLRSLDFLEENFKQQYVNLRQKALLLVRGKVYEREINPVDATIIDIFDEVLSGHVKNKELVLVILPTDSSKRYVLQTGVIGRFVDRFRLKVLDPRKDIRFPFKKSDCRAKVWPLSDHMAVKMQVGALHAIRDNQDVDGQLKVIDGLCEPDENDLADDYRSLLTSAALSATMVDVSLGGSCLIAKRDTRLQAHQLLVVELTLVVGEVSALLRPLAVIRNSQDCEQGLKLHLCFISRLDDEVEAFLGGLIVEK